MATTTEIPKGLSRWAATVRTAALLRRGRAQLVERTLVRDRALFDALYDYDESPALRALLFEREAVGWVDSHADLIRDAVARTPDGAPRGAGRAGC